MEFADKLLNGWRSAHTLKPTADRPSGQIYKEWTESAQSVHYTPVREHKTRKARAVNGHWALWKCNLLVCVGSLVPSFNRALPCSFVSVQAFCIRWCKLFWPTSGMILQELKKKITDRNLTNHETSIVWTANRPKDKLPSTVSQSTKIVGTALEALRAYE